MTINEEPYPFVHLMTGRKVEVKIITEFADDSLQDLIDADGKPVEKIVFAVVVSSSKHLKVYIQLLDFFLTCKERSIIERKSIHVHVVVYKNL